MDLDYKEIGKRIALRRKDMGLKQSEVEERADLSQNTSQILNEVFQFPL